MIIKLILFFLNLVAKCYKAKFLHSLNNCEKAQRKTLKDALKFYQDTDFGKDIKLNQIQDYNAFKSLNTFSYEKLESYILQDKSRPQKAILSKKPIAWELSSGSSGIKKHIPYTKYAFKTFHSLIMIWISDLLSHAPKFNGGKVFFSISPKSSLQTEATIEDDSEYLPKVLTLFFGKYILLPKGLKKIRDHFEYKTILCLSLLQERNLEMLFIWSPTYLLSLMDFITENKEHLQICMKKNEFQANGQTFKFHFSKNQKELFEDHFSPSKIWPKLSFISCWADASSAQFIKKLQELFPSAMIQPKGLISTEAVMTIPLLKPQGFFPLISDNFYEFRDKENNIYPLWELKQNEIYNIIITNRSGFFRYEVGDFVQVESFYKSIPSLRFVGRNKVVDITGEKLNELLIAEIFNELNQADEKSFLFPVIKKEKIFYKCITNSIDKDYQERLENRLLKIPHYQESRRNNQLQQVVIEIEDRVLERYYKYFTDKGMILGDIKFSPLLKDFE